MDTNRVEDATVEHCPKDDPLANLGHCADARETAVFLGDTGNPCHSCSYGKVASVHLKKVKAAELLNEV